MAYAYPVAYPVACLVACLVAWNVGNFSNSPGLLRQWVEKACPGAAGANPLAPGAVGAAGAYRLMPGAAPKIRRPVLRIAPVRWLT